ncbi:MAG: hypothetical protein V1838_03690 [Patescibacteria group bacterium]
MKNNNQQGIAVNIVIIIILAVIIAGSLVWYFLSYKKADQNANLVTNAVTNTVLNANSASNTNAAPDISDWQIYTNNNYHYQIAYPADWSYLPDAMSGPPPPVTAVFSNVNDTSLLPYASLNLVVSDLMGETLDTWGEIESLEADGYERSNIMVSGQTAVRLERHSHIMDSGATIYMTKDNYIYRLVWGATDPDTYTAYEDIAEAMAASFTFIEPVTATFIQTGILTRPAESQDWYLLWEAPGNPAINKKLVFDTEGFISNCILSDSSQGRCIDLLVNGLLNAGDSISVEGILNEDSDVDVITITVL